MGNSTELEAGDSNEATRSGRLKAGDSNEATRSGRIERNDSKRGTRSGQLGQTRRLEAGNSKRETRTKRLKAGDSKRATRTNKATRSGQLEVDDSNKASDPKRAIRRERSEASDPKRAIQGSSNGKNERDGSVNEWNTSCGRWSSKQKSTRISTHCWGPRGVGHGGANDLHRKDRTISQRGVQCPEDKGDAATDIACQIHPSNRRGIQKK